MYQPRIFSQERLHKPHEHKQDTHGDYPSSPKPDHIFRLLYNNINGISTTNFDEESHQIGHTSDAHHIDYLGLAETNINWTNNSIFNKIQYILQKFWSQSIITTSTIHRTTPSSYQPGGTLALLGNNWTGGATASKDISGMGRWTSIRIQGRQHQQLYIITTYRVPKTTINNAGSNTSYYYQWHHLRRKGTPVPDPRQQLLTDLGYYIASVKTDTTAVIIAIDANESYTDRNSPLHKWMMDYSLVDLHMALYDIDTSIPTHNRGSKRIDYIFGTTNIVPYVTNGGILPFHFLTNTDHRGLYIDVELQKFLRGNPPASSTLVNRTLRTNHPRGYRTYCDHLIQWLKESQLEQRLQKISQTLHPLAEDQLMQLHALEEEFSTARLNAEKRISKQPHHPWSPKLKNAQLSVYYYKLWVSQFKTSHDYHQQRDRLSLPSTRTPTTHRQAQKFLREAQKHLKEVKMNAQKLRDSHLEDRIARYNLVGDEHKSKAINHIKRVETLKRTYKKIRSLKQGRSKSHFNHLIISQDNQDQVITDPDDIIKHLIDRNQKHFGQAQGTPFSIPPLNSCTQIKHLDNIPQDLPEAVQDIIQYLKRTPSLPAIETTITSTDLHRMYGHWNENTTTSPSGLHLGHDQCPRYYDAENATTELSQRLYTIKSQFINVALQHGIIYQQWQHTNTIMIEKIPGNYNINKLRALHIF